MQLRCKWGERRKRGYLVRTRQGWLQPPGEAALVCCSSTNGRWRDAAEAQIQSVEVRYPKWLWCLGQHRPQADSLSATVQILGLAAQLRALPLLLSASVSPLEKSTRPQPPRVQQEEKKRGHSCAPNAASSELTAELNSSLETHPKTKSSHTSPAKPLPPALTGTSAAPRANNPNQTATNPAQNPPHSSVGWLGPHSGDRTVPRAPQTLPGMSTYLC